MPGLSYSILTTTFWDRCVYFLPSYRWGNWSSEILSKSQDYTARFWVLALDSLRVESQIRVAHENMFEKYNYRQWDNIFESFCKWKIINEIVCQCLLQDIVLEQWFWTGGDFVPRHIWQCLETFSVVATGSGRCYWHLVIRSQRRCDTSYNAQDSHPQ